MAKKTTDQTYAQVTGQSGNVLLSRTNNQGVKKYVVFDTSRTPGGTGARSDVESMKKAGYEVLATGVQGYRGPVNESIANKILKNPSIRDQSIQGPIADFMSSNSTNFNISDPKVDTPLRGLGSGVPNLQSIPLSDVRAPGEAFNPMQDLQRSQMAASKAGLPAGGFTPVKTPTTFNAVDLGKNKAPVVPPSSQTDTSGNFAGSLTSGLQTSDDIYKQRLDALNKQFEPINKETQGITERIKQIMGKQESSQTTYDKAFQKELNKMGDPEVQKKLADLNVQIAQRTADYNARIAALPGQGRGISTNIVAGQTDREKRMALVELGNLGIIKLAYQENIQAAKETASQVVSFMYKDEERSIQNQLTLLQLNKDSFDRKEKQLADERTMILQDRQAAIEKEKSELLAVKNLAIDAAKNGAPVDVTQNMAKATSLDQALSIGGQYLSEVDDSADLDKLLTPTESAALGVDYGLTRREAMQLGINPKDLKEIGGLTPEQRKELSNIQNTRRQDPDIKGFYDVRDAKERLDAAASDPSAAGDIAIVFSYMKMLDPTSVVREGEQATAQNAGGVDDRIRNMYNKALTGERFTPEQRTDFTTTANRLYEVKRKRYQEAEAFYQGQASNFDIPSELVGRDLSATGSNNTNIGSLPPLKKSYNTPEELVADIPEYKDVVNKMIDDGLSDNDILQTLSDESFNNESQTSLKGKVAVAYPSGSYGGQCGDFAHKIVDFPPVGNTFSQKVASVQKNGILKKDWVPKVGDVVVTDGSDVTASGKPYVYGHMMVVDKINPDGSLSLIESNAKGNERVSIGRTIYPDDPAVYGALRGTIKKQYLA